MSHARLFPTGFTLVAILSLAAPAVADPIQITSGSLTVSGAQDFLSRGYLRSIWLDLSTDTFRLVSGESDGPPQNIFSPRVVNYAELTPAGAPTDAVHLTAIFTVLATPSVSPTPFTLAGTLAFAELGTSIPLFTIDVVGRGTASWEFVQTPTGGSVVSQVVYEFTPVPEPMTLLMIAGGLAGIGAARRRRGSAR